MHNKQPDNPPLNRSLYICSHFTRSLTSLDYPHTQRKIIIDNRQWAVNKSAICWKHSRWISLHNTFAGITDLVVFAFHAEFGCSCKNICSNYGIVTTGCDVRCVLHYRAATATQSDAPSQCLPRYVRCTRADGGCREFVVWPQWKDVACKVKPNTNRSRRDTTNILSGTSLIRRRYACVSSNLLSLEKLRWVCDLANLMDNNIEWLLISVWQQLASTP